MFTPDQIRGCLFGLLVGDAMGVPYEFRHSADIPPDACRSMRPPPGFDRTYPEVPIGSWSDDGAMALCLLASLVFRGELDLTDLGNRFLNWRNCGYMASEFRVFDIGQQTSRSLDLIEGGLSPERAGGTTEESNGNGALMRVAPLVLWHPGDDDVLAHLAQRQGLPTHAHPRSQVCCALYCLWLRFIHRPDAWSKAVGILRDLYSDRPRFLRELDLLDSHSTTWGNGYVVDTLLSARHLLDKHDSYRAVVTAAVRMGRDTDTTAAVAGAAAGLKYGLTNIPDDWLADLRDKETAELLVDQLTD